jgi:hypothetical protein
MKITQLEVFLYSPCSSIGRSLLAPSAQSRFTAASTRLPRSQGGVSGPPATFTSRWR